MVRRGRRSSTGGSEGGATEEEGDVETLDGRDFFYST